MGLDRGLVSYDKAVSLDACDVRNSRFARICRSGIPKLGCSILHGQTNK